MIVLLYCFNLPLTGYLSSKMVEHKFMDLTILQIRKSFEFFGEWQYQSDKSPSHTLNTRYTYSAKTISL